MLGNCCCPLKSKFLLSKLKAASGYGCDKGNLYIKQMSAVDSLLGPVTFLMNFQADFHCNLCIFIFLWSLNLLLPTDSLASVIKISMPCLADSGCRKQVANLSKTLITLLPAPICLAVFVTMKVPTRVSKMSAESEWSDMRWFSPEGLLAF